MMKVYLFLALLCLTAFADDCQSVDPNDFVLPAGLPPPNVPPGPVFALYFGLLGSFVPPILTHETPIAIRFTSNLDTITWNCVAAYNTGHKDAFTLSRPWVDNIPGDLHTSEARVLCAVYGFGAVIDELIPSAKDSYLGFTSSLGLSPATSVSAEVEVCAQKPSTSEKRACFEELAECNGFKPEVVGAITARMTLEQTRSDGWNADGALSSNGEPCTANCRPFTDPTGYSPVNHPGMTMKGLEHRWQPLLEDNGLGFFYRQEHVTPHIGKTGRTRLLSRKKFNKRVTPDPEYDYELEANLVIERLKNLANDDLQKMTVEFMDNKISVALAIVQGLLAAHPETTFEQVSLFVLGFTAAEYDSVLLAWKEKVNHDLIRPTTVIQERNNGEDDITTWGGPFAGLKTIKARDFQPYVRVMPHAEYPSGSGCICEVISEFGDIFLAWAYNDFDSIPVQVQFPAGSSNTEPGVVPAQDETLFLPNLRTLRNVCGQSRLDGGMHFTASVPAAYDLCDGVGREAFKYIRRLIPNDESSSSSSKSSSSSSSSSSS